MALHEVHIEKGQLSKFEDYKAVFEDSALLRHYGEYVWDWVKQGLMEESAFVAVDRNGEYVGFMWMQMESMYANQPYLSLLGVRKDYRGHGVGEMLIRHFIKLYEDAGYDRGLIAVNDFNPRARLLYESMGFHKIAQFPEALTPETNDLYLLMRKSGFQSNV